MWLRVVSSEFNAAWSNSWKLEKLRSTSDVGCWPRGCGTARTECGIRDDFIVDVEELKSSYPRGREVGLVLTDSGFDSRMSLFLWHTVCKMRRTGELA